LGDQVHIGPDAVIGPDAILENRVFIDSAAEVESSFVGSETFVGRLTRIKDSIAWGSTLIDWRSGSCTQVPDPFLLSALGRHSHEARPNRPSLSSTLWRSALGRPWELAARFAEKFNRR
jgi:NDP-sugar pyrophosphorylase family protein